MRDFGIEPQYAIFAAILVVAAAGFLFAIKRKSRSGRVVRLKDHRRSGLARPSLSMLLLMGALAYSIYEYRLNKQVTWITQGFVGGEALLDRASGYLRPWSNQVSTKIPGPGPAPQGHIESARQSQRAGSVPMVAPQKRNKPGESPDSAVAGYDFFGSVVNVIDGDTIELEDNRYGQQRIRLHGIDSPERGQPYSSAATRALENLVDRRSVGVIEIDVDSYGRTVGVVFVHDQNVNLEMVRSGYAWWYRRYARSDGELRRAEETARDAGIGLWANDNPVAPWDWRHRYE